MPAQDEIQFSTFRRGYIRDEIILASFRNSLRNLINRATGAAYTEDEIALATQPGTKYYLEADSIDLLSQAMQAKARWMANQTVPHRANTAMLENVHGPLWIGEDSRLPAVGGGGVVSAPATVGAIFPGSTELDSPTAAIATDPNGARYQVLYTTTTGDGGTAPLLMKGIDTGYETNIPAGTVLTWSQNQPIGAEPSFTLGIPFSGGAPIESDAEYADRIESIIRYRPGAGNSAHFMAWTREVEVSVEYGFVYPTFQYPGSVMVSVTQKRSSAKEIDNINGISYKGPNARTSLSEATLNAITRYIVPPYSQIVPEDWYVVVTRPTPQPSDCVIQLHMGLGTNGGWYDRVPWPNPSDAEPEETVIAMVSDQTHFTVTVDANDYLPGMTGDGTLTGNAVPNIMVWDDETSRFEQLQVLSITKSGTSVSITLSTEPTHVTLTTGMRISPYTELKDLVSAGAEQYFDELGPGELFDVTTDPRGPRASRYPPRIEIYPSHAGQSILNRITDQLGPLAPDGHVVSMSYNEPDYPDDVINGPNMLTLGHLTIYPL